MGRIWRRHEAHKNKFKWTVMFDEKLFLELAKEMNIEVVESSKKDTVNGLEVDALEIVLRPFKESEETEIEG